MAELIQRMYKTEGYKEGEEMCRKHRLNEDVSQIVPLEVYGTHNEQGEEY